jgi:hypothetical protein
MEGCGVVVVDGVAEFVQDDKLAKMLGKEHRKERYAYVVATAARAPACMCRGDAQRGVVEAEVAGKALDGVRNVLACLAA